MAPPTPGNATIGIIPSSRIAFRSVRAHALVPKVASRVHGRLGCVRKESFEPSQVPKESLEVVRRGPSQTHSNFNMSDLTIYSRLNGKLALMYVPHILILQPSTQWSRARLMASHNGQSSFEPPSYQLFFFSRSGSALGHTKRQHWCLCRYWKGHRPPICRLWS